MWCIQVVRTDSVISIEEQEEETKRGDSQECDKQKDKALAGCG